MPKKNLLPPPMMQITTLVVLIIFIAAYLLLHHSISDLGPMLARPVLASATGNPGDDLAEARLPNSPAEVFSKSSPLRTKLAQLRYTVVQSPLSTTIWDKEIFDSRTAVTTDIPMYFSSASDPLITVGRCTSYGGRCSMAGKRIHVNPSDIVQGCASQGGPPGSFCDGHLLLIDKSENIEVDCWGARNGGGQQTNRPPFTVDLSNKELVCAWGGWYPLNSTGLNGKYANENAASNGSGIAFGPAAGLFMITPTELLTGHIDHAIALNAVCVDAPSVYPSDYGTTDTTCDGGTNYPHYGDAIMYVGKSDAEIASSARSIPCKAILTAMHDYGAYFSDTGDNVTRLDVVSEYSFNLGSKDEPHNPWTKIYSELAEAGDGDTSGYWNGCFNGLRNTDFNLIELQHP